MTAQEELAHSGVLGMKWGVSRADKAGTVYKSGRTKRLERAEKSYRESAKEFEDLSPVYTKKGKLILDSKTIKSIRDDFRKESEKASEKLNRSMTIDKLKSDYIRSLSNGKAISDAFFLGNHGMNTQVTSQLLGVSKGRAAVNSLITMNPITGTTNVERAYVKTGKKLNQ